MRAWGRPAAGLALALAVVLGTAALSRAPYDATRGEGALLRLSWRARGERVEECRKLSPEELEALPPHMRRPEVCEGRVLPYVLAVRLDGREIVHDTIHGAGARQDRPLYVFREIPLPPGRHRLTVEFTRERRPDERREEHDDRSGEEHDHGDEPKELSAQREEPKELSAQREEPEATERSEEHDVLATPPRLELGAVVRLTPGEVALVTYDAERRSLLLRTPGDRP